MKDPPQKCDVCGRQKNVPGIHELCAKVRQHRDTKFPRYGKPLTPAQVEKLAEAYRRIAT